MTKQKNKRTQGNQILLIILGLIGLGVLITLLLQNTDVTLFNPKGMIAQQQLNLALFTTALLFIISIPVLIILYSFAWKYRETNRHSTYDPEARDNKLFIFGMWALPSIFMLVLALVVGPATHRLDHKQPIVSINKPITIQVVAMRWKWLFYYPEQNIATVNFVQVPVDTPVHFEITADETPMSSFWIPHLGGQLYAMTGHVNQLNLIADEEGDYPGSSAEINGKGFAGMKFIARASSQVNFDQWVREMQQSPDVLDNAEYDQLLKPSEANPVAHYSSYDSGLYGKMLMKYMGSHGSHSTKNEVSKH